jgi:hypothetical protein
MLPKDWTAEDRQKVCTIPRPHENAKGAWPHEADIGRFLMLVLWSRPGICTEYVPDSRLKRESTGYFPCDPLKESFKKRPISASRGAAEPPLEARNGSI